MEECKKLVRDNVPSIIENNGQKCDIDTLKDEYALEYLYIRLHENIFNLLDTESVDELADILEVVFSIGEKYGYTPEDIINKKEEIKSQYGVFEKNIFLKKIY
ncbi:MAG: nucleoside triphosphate pyrophosphohydrolase [Romboutsia sp.]